MPAVSLYHQLHMQSKQDSWERQKGQILRFRVVIRSNTFPAPFSRFHQEKEEGQKLLGKPVVQPPAGGNLNVYGAGLIYMKRQ